MLKSFNQSRDEYLARIDILREKILELEGLELDHQIKTRLDFGYCLGDEITNDTILNIMSAAIGYSNKGPSL